MSVSPTSCLTLEIVRREFLWIQKLEDGNRVLSVEMAKLGPVHVPGERAATDDKESRTDELTISFYTRAGTGFN